MTKLELKKSLLSCPGEMNRVLSEQKKYYSKGEFTRKINSNEIIDLRVDFKIFNQSILYEVLINRTEKHELVISLELYSTNDKIYSVDFSDINISKASIALNI